MPADLLDVGVRPTDPTGVHDHDVERTGGPADPLRLGLHRSVRAGVAAREVLRQFGFGGGGLGDGKGLTHRLVVQLMAERGEEEPRDEHDHPGRDGHLGEQDLGEDAAGPVNAHAYALCLPCGLESEAPLDLCERNVNAAAAADQPP